MYDDLSLPNCWKCKMSTFPYDDLFLDYNETVKDNFLTHLKAFYEDAKIACDEKSLIKATKLWQKHLGDRFDVAEKDPEESQKDKLSSLAAQVTGLVAGTSGVNSSGKIASDRHVIPMQQHRNFGGEAPQYPNGPSFIRNQRWLKNQKKELQRKVNGLKCRFEGGGLTLVCKWNVQPKDCGKYKIEMVYAPGNAPRFYVRSPIIENSASIHRYRDGALCLFYPGDFKWTDEKSILNNFFPWVVEWILYYEMWKITGTWLGNEVTHSNQK